MDARRESLGQSGVRRAVLGTFLLALLPSAAAAQSLSDRVEHHYVDSDGTSIHYVTLGEGPPIVMVHGFPDYWYTWRDQMEALAAEGYRVAAMDTRGYNLSGQPERVEDYAMPLLVADVAAVIGDLGGRAVLVGHDWGGFISWNVAMQHPDLLAGLAILNLPHPKGLTRELANNPEQQQNSQYARNFQAEGSHERLSTVGLATWVTDIAARSRYVEAFERSSLFGMMAYYKANYPREPYQEIPDEMVTRIRVPVLQIHGLSDQYLLAPALDGTWKWLDADYTLVTLPGVGHFVQQDASESVTESLLMWLQR